MAKDWVDVWEELKIGGTGGQGIVTKTRHKVTKQMGALKVMHSQNMNSSERRQRMAREVRLLEDLNGNGIPNVLDHNMNAVDDKSVPLWFVSDWIEGKTLEQYTNGKPLSIDLALQITRQLLVILDRIHQRDVMHRDIKPQNILVQGDRDNPVVYLVDFGIAFVAADEENNWESDVGHELGNRFLRIPDYFAGSRKRDLRSDLTQAVAILFYLLTGITPRSIIDMESRPPHAAYLSEIPENLIRDERWKLLRSIFEVGFQPDINLRWQTSDALIKRIDEILNPVPKPPTVSTIPTELSRFRELLNFAEVAARLKIEKAMLEISRKLEDALRELAIVSGLQSVHNSDWAWISEPGRAVEFSYMLSRKGMRTPLADLVHIVELVPPNLSNVRAHYSVARRTVTYYEGPAADVERLENEVMGQVETIFSLTVAELTEQMRKTYSQS